jgi:hypothetical protein
MELDVLQGAVKTITRCRPIMFVENDRAESSAELISFLFGLNYRLWWHRTPYFDPNNVYGETTNVFEKNIESRNILCVHKDMSVPVDLPEITSADGWPLRAL